MVVARRKVDDDEIDGILCVFMYHRRPTLEKFKLRISQNFSYYSHLGDTRFPKAIKDITRWICAALSRKPKILDLSFCVSSTCMNEIFFRHAWNCDSVVQMRVDNIEFQGLDTATINMPSLKVLTLSCVDINVAFRDIIRWCPVLQVLNIEDGSLGTTKFYAPILQELILKNASLHYRRGFYVIAAGEFIVSFDDLHLFGMFLKSPFYQVQTLVLSESFLGMFAFATLKNFPCGQNSSKHVIVNTSGNYLEGIFGLLRSSPQLEELTINFDVNSFHGGIPNHVAKELEGSSTNNFKVLNSGSANLTCLRESLQQITICGYDKQTCHHVHYVAGILLRSAEVLFEFTVKWKPKFRKEEDEVTTDELSSFSQKLSTLPRASKSAIVSLLKGD